jgi:hypothetical protein
VYNASQTDNFLERYFPWLTDPEKEKNNFEWLSHSIYPTKIAVPELKVSIGNEQCSQPYNACIFHVGSIEDSDLESSFVHATNESEFEYSSYSVCEGLNTYRLADGGLLWQVAADQIGIKNGKDNFNSREFKKNAGRQEVKMIELKLSTALKHIDPVYSFLGFAEQEEKTVDTGIFSASASRFTDAEGMIHFLQYMRELSAYKPVGIRLCINDKKEFYQICHAIRKTKIAPDFIVVEGCFEVTGILHPDLPFHRGIPLYEALIFVSQTLQLYGLQDQIRIIASGKIISSFEILKILALGADVVFTEMPHVVRLEYGGDDSPVSLHYKSKEVYAFHDKLMKETVQIMKVCGFKCVTDITLSKFFSRLDVLHSKNLEQLDGPPLYPGSVKKIYRNQRVFDVL